MSKTNINKLHKIDIEILKEVVNICDKNNLKYYMIGGTMLGAIRHKGFIPWDDDIDLGLPRDDYEKFLSIAPTLLSKRLSVVNFKTDPDYPYYITRIQDTDTKVIEIRYKHENKFTHASIDLFPLDGTPNNLLLRKLYYLRILMHRAMMSLHYKKGIDSERKRSVLEGLFLKMMTKLPTDKMFNAFNQKSSIDKILKKYKMCESGYTGNIMGAYRTREIVPTKFYGKDSFYQFENMNLRGFEMYDEYLKHIYGDYMKIPSEENRKTHFEIVEL